MRKKERFEIFTPDDLVNQVLDKLPSEMWEEGRTFCDPACGDGQFLVWVLRRKIVLRHSNPLQTIYGVDIMEDNVYECRKRLLEIAGTAEENKKIVDSHIVVADALKYEFDFS